MTVLLIVALFIFWLPSMYIGRQRDRYYRALRDIRLALGTGTCDVCPACKRERDEAVRLATAALARRSR